MDFTNLVRAAGVIQDALRRSGFTGIDVRHDADIAHFFERYGAGHKSLINFKHINRFLPAIVRKGLVRLRHTVYIVFFLHRAAANIRGFVQFIGQLLGHALFRARCGPAQ